MRNVTWLGLLAVLVVSCGGLVTHDPPFEDAVDQGGAYPGTAPEAGVGGYGGPCDPGTERACANSCGAGIERCIDRGWSPCDARATRECATFCGPGIEVCEDDAWRSCSAIDPVWPVFEAIIRDFSSDHPDMEEPGWSTMETGLVLPTLGPDGKPVYSGVAYERIESADTFAQWYRDVPGVNQSTTYSIVLQPVGGDEEAFRFSDPEFFPIDDQLLGNEGRPHNYHFTLELVTRFRYAGGEVFAFSGDDDLWVYINEQLAIDLGGEHKELSETVVLDDAAPRLGMIVGEEYPLHLFFAERHTHDSHFTIETTIRDWDACR